MVIWCVRHFILLSCDLLLKGLCSRPSDLLNEHHSFISATTFVPNSKILTFQNELALGMQYLKRLKGLMQLIWCLLMWVVLLISFYFILRAFDRISSLVFQLYMMDGQQNGVDHTRLPVSNTLTCLKMIHTIGSWRAICWHLIAPLVDTPVKCLERIWFLLSFFFASSLDGLLLSLFLYIAWLADRWQCGHQQCRNSICLQYTWPP